VSRTFPFQQFILAAILAIPATCAVSISGAGSLSVSVDPNGTYDITHPGLSWRFSGNVGAHLVNINVASSANRLGPYSEISFDFVTDVVRHASIRSYGDRTNVLFTVSSDSSAPNNFAFPNFSQFPRNLDHVTFSGTFAPPSFWYLASESPWFFFDSSYNAFVLSPASNFMSASTNWGPKGELLSGIAREIATLPPGFEHQTLLVMEKGINRAFDSWGQALTALRGKTRPANDSDVSLNKVGYWTDNGATYYYQTAGAMNYEQTLMAIKGDFDRLGIGLGYVQLDSWFYPKGPAAVWDGNGQGIYEYIAASRLFGAGLSNFQRRLGVPLITHARWIDPSSPYRTSYKMSGNVVTDSRYWDTVAGYLATSGVAIYEQDWLNDKAQPDFNLTDADEFLDNMAASMAQRKLTMQYCMASPRHFLQSTKYDHLTTIRTSADRLGRDRWTDFLYTSRLASALGVWPFTDNFNSTETTHMLIATLSAGPVGVGDPVGKLSAANLLRSVRQDGVIVKPDVPLTPTDSSYWSMSHGVDTPQINSTYSDFGGLRTHYVFAYTQGTNSQAGLSPSDFGAAGPVYLYDYFARKGQVAEASDVIRKQIAGDALYLVAAPIGPSGLAILGDLDQFVPMGKKRIPAMSDDGSVNLTIAFAKGEAVRAIHGYSPVWPASHATDGAIGPVTYDAATKLFQIPVSPGADGLATIVIHQARSDKRRPTDDRRTQSASH